MKLRFRTIGSLFITMCLLLAAFSFYSKLILEKGFVRMEEREAKINVGRVKDAIWAEQVQLQSRMKDWASWDDVYQYVYDKNAAFEKSNLIDASILNLGLNVLVFIDENGDIVFGRNIDLAANRVYPLHEDVLRFLKEHPRLLHGPEDRKAKIGLTFMGDAPLMISSQAILTSESKGSTRGTLFVGRLIDKERLKALSKVTHLDLDLRSYYDLDLPQDFIRARNDLKNSDDVFVRPGSESEMAGYFSLWDLDGKPLFLVKITTGREIQDLGRMTFFSLFGSIMVVGLSLMAVVAFILNRSVLNRVLHLNSKFKSIREGEDLGLRVPVEGKDEIAELGMEINRTLSGLEQNKNDLLLILNNVNQGLFTFDSKGMTGAQCSLAARDIFGVAPSQSRVADVLKQDMGHWEEILSVVFQGKRVFESILEFLPKEISLNGKIIDINYRPIYDKKKELNHVLVVATDVTKVRQLERETKKNHDLGQCLIRILKNKNEFKELVLGVKGLAATSADRNQFRRNLHTIKGGLGFFGFQELVQLCHQWETDMESLDFRLLAGEIEQKVEYFLTENKDILNLNFFGEKTIVVSAERLQKIIRQQQTRPIGPAELVEELQDLLKVSLQDRLGWIDLHLVNLAQKASKMTHPIVWPSQPMIELVGYEDLFQSFVHIIQNIVDHGIESPEDRQDAGKELCARVKIDFEFRDGVYYITFEDDGKGADLAKIRTLAAQKGMSLPPNASHDEILDLIFHLGFSTAETVTETSGRGVGLSAVRHEAQKLQGDVKAFLPLNGKSGMRIVVWFKAIREAPKSQLNLVPQQKAA